MKKYELTDETLKIGGRTLHRIRALRDFADVKAGNIGGWIEFKDNLSHDDNAWVYGRHALYTVTNIGSRNSTTTFFNCKDGNIGVSCGCFRGSIDEFAQAVKKTHGDNKFAKQYEVAIQLAKEAIETSAFEED